MKLTVLTENTAISPEFKAVHGLSLVLETNEHSILFDVGPGDEFIHNANLLSIDLSKIDLCAISHGHNDHGGGLRLFLDHNTTAPVYMAESAFEDCFAGSKYIGLNRELKDHPQIKLLPKKHEVFKGITLLSKIPGNILLPKANANLLDEKGPDPFLHEQVMLVEESGQLVLLGGCAHRGIVNILEHTKSVAGRYPDVVISGLHLAAGGSGRCMAEDCYLEELASWLLKTGAMFYSCHCTGQEALSKLQKLMPGKLKAISTGMIINL